jgi:hypothetical protein
LNNWTIRLKHTALASYTNYLWEGSGWTVVQQTNRSITTPGWVWFPFTTPFNYNGTDSLMVDFSFNNSSYTTSGAARATARTGVRVLNYYTDSGAGDPLTWSGSTPTPYTASATPNLRLLMSGGAANPVVPALVCFTNGLWTGFLAVQNPGTNVVLHADDGGGHLGDSNPFNVLPGGAPVLTWSFSGSMLTLAWSGTGYHLQAQTNSSGGGLSSNWFDYPGGGSSPVMVPFNPAHPSVFYRLISP